MVALKSHAALLFLHCCSLTFDANNLQWICSFGYFVLAKLSFVSENGSK